MPLIVYHGGVKIATVLLLALPLAGAEKTYDYWLAGDAADATPATRGGAALLGGGGDVAEAFEWMLERSRGGDFVVLRASGADAYHPYLMKLGKPDSVETILTRSRAAAYDPFVIERVRRADALFLAGGDQWNYISRWKGTPIEDAIHELVKRRAPIGGSSAGLAVLGRYYFSAKYNTVRSETLLKNPYDKLGTIGSDFLRLPFLGGLITDSHFMARNREGRLLAWLAKIVQEGWELEARGIGIDEATAVLVDEDGSARVAGKGAAHFYRTTTEPEVCAPGKPLTIRGIEVRRLKAGGRFHLPDWKSPDGEAATIAVENGEITR